MSLTRVAATKLNNNRPFYETYYVSSRSIWILKKTMKSIKRQQGLI